jgi:integrase
MNTWRIERHMVPLPDREGELFDHLKPLVLLAINTGLRRGELFSLRWADVNLSAKVVTVVAASAKSGSKRHIPLNAEALATLEAWRERAKSTDGLVFPSIDGARLNNINKSWAGVIKIAGLENFKFHDLRHTFASKLVQAGVDLNTVRELLGHSEIATTLIYSHLSPGNLRAAVERVVANS